MKKSFIIFAAGALGVLSSCNPIKDDESLSVTEISEDQLLANATFKQFAAVVDENGNVTGYTEAADGNYIQFNIPGVTGLNIFTLNEDGSEKMLQNAVTGTFTYTGGGMFILMPRRGSSPNQTVIFRYTNQDGKSVQSYKDFTVAVPSDMAYEMKLLCSNDYGEKVWKWDTSITGAVWGNMGYCGGAGRDVGVSGNGQWWGITTSEEFNNQLQHTEDGTNHGDGDLDAYMVFNEDGTVTSYDKAGNVIRKNSFKVEGYDNSNPDAWKVGDLVTDAILWPYQINWKDNGYEAIPGTYEICYLTSDKMTLVYPDGGKYGELGNWGEATFWHFYSDSDLLGMVAGYEKGKDWTWDPSITGAVWGNMGYCGGDGADVGKSGNGQWWGVTSTEEFNGQLQHSHNGVNNGDGDLDAYMTFGTDGILTSYKADGSVINSGTYEFKPVKDNAWKKYDLYTTSILWPYQINWKDNGVDPIPGEYEVVYVTSEKMTLVYPDKGDYGSLGNWGEATFWHFKAK